MLAALLLLLLHPHPPLPDTPEEIGRVAEEELGAELARQAALSEQQRVVIVRLQEMVAVEQAGREFMSRIKEKGLPIEEQRAAQSAVWQVLMPIDEANQAELQGYMDKYGWFPASVWGWVAADDAWLIAQHGPLDMQKTVLERMEPLLATNDAGKSNYALMFDRVAMREGRPQRYGSQMTCVDGRYRRHEIEDPEGLDERRAAMGLSPMDEYVSRFGGAC